MKKIILFVFFVLGNVPVLLSQNLIFCSVVKYQTLSPRDRESMRMDSVVIYFRNEQLRVNLHSTSYSLAYQSSFVSDREEIFSLRKEGRNINSLPTIERKLIRKTNQFKNILGYRCRLYHYQNRYGSETKELEIWSTDQIMPSGKNKIWDSRFTEYGLILEERIKGEIHKLAISIEYKAVSDSIFYKQ